MLAENEWRIHGDNDAGGQWHMPQQTLDWVRKPGFCRGVQKLFVDAIEGDGYGMLSLEMLYPDPSMRFTSLCRNVPTMTRAEAEKKFRFPWKMPLAIYEPGHLYDALHEDTDEQQEAQGPVGDESAAANAALQRVTPKPPGSEMYLYCMRCTRYRAEAEWFQYNAKHSIRYCNDESCEACRVPQLQLCWFCALEDGVTHDAEEADETARICGVVHWLLHVLDERLHAAVGETHEQLDFLLGRGALDLGAQTYEKWRGVDKGFLRIYREQHLFGHSLHDQPQKSAAQGGHEQGAPSQGQSGEARTGELPSLSSGDKAADATIELRIAKQVRDRDTRHTRGTMGRSRSRSGATVTPPS